MTEEILHGEQDISHGVSRAQHIDISSRETAAIVARNRAGEKSSSQHRIFVRPAIGATARIIQHNRLRYSNLAINRPIIILVERGTKIMRSGDHEVTVQAGGAIAVCQNQIFDVINEAEAGGIYLARWIAFEPDMILSQPPQKSPVAPVERALALEAPSKAFLDAYHLAVEAIADPDGVPDTIADHRLRELLLWLDLSGGRFAMPQPDGFAQKARNILTEKPGYAWSGVMLARTLSVSEATLRRKLSAEGWSFQALLADVRMSIAMQLLQSTDRPVLHIAQDVGYESQSRFAIRFRARFGFAPSTIRGHRR